MEAILALVSLGLAVPGTVIAIAECGQYIEQKVSSFKSAPAIAHDLGRFGRELHSGKLKLSIDLAAWAYSLPDLDQVMKDAIEDHINQLESRLKDVDFALNKLFDRSGEVRRLYYTILGERKAERLIKSLREWEHEFSNTLLLIEMKKRVLPHDLLLTRERYRCRQQTQLSSNKQFYVGAAELMKGGDIVQLEVLIERKDLLTKDSNADLQEVACMLAELTGRGSFKGGVLKCIGYKISEVGELVFELPPKHDKPKTLRDILLADKDKTIGGGNSLDDRLSLAQHLCDTVVAVFTSGLVHKSIRTDTILMIRDHDTSQAGALGEPYLSSWTLLRKATALTSGPGEGDYTTDFYRHPKRQGIQPEDRYNIGHDIYSLGVCLLEIGLWMSFFDGDGNPCNLYREAVINSGILSASDAGSITQLTMPWVVSKVLPEIAKHQLPPRMGNRFARLTLACLTCLEEGMGDTACFRKNQPIAAIRFNELVAQSFSLQ